MINVNPKYIYSKNPDNGKLYQYVIREIKGSRFYLVTHSKQDCCCSENCEKHSLWWDEETKVFNNGAYQDKRNNMFCGEEWDKKYKKQLDTEYLLESIMEKTHDTYDYWEGYNDEPNEIDHEMWEKVADILGIQR